VFGIHRIVTGQCKTWVIVGLGEREKFFPQFLWAVGGRYYKHDKANLL